MTRIRPRDRDAIVRALQKGAVPRSGLDLVRVGRDVELVTVTADLTRVAGGGSANRLVVGAPGTGKTFMLRLARSAALERRLVTVHADQRPHGTMPGFGDLMRTMATRARPGGGAMVAVVERFLTGLLHSGQDPRIAIRRRLDALREQPGGVDFVEVVARYWEAYDRGDEQLRTDALRWWHAELPDAGNALGVGPVGDWWAHIALWGRLSHAAGFGGLLVCLDGHVPAATPTPHVGIYATGLPDSPMDTMRLPFLSSEDIGRVLRNLLHVWAAGDPVAHLVPDEAVDAFITHCAARAGNAAFRAPRRTICGFLEMLAILDRSPTQDWRTLISGLDVTPESSESRIPATVRASAPVPPRTPPTVPAARSAAAPSDAVPSDA